MDPSETQEAIFFLELTKIPRPSGHMEGINRYLEGFAEEHGLECETDSAGNVLIRRGGKGRTVVLQGHQDIVPNSVREFDFESTPLRTVVEDGWIRADGTTLGADDGGGLALMLCALVSPDLEGIPLECLFTADEEVGLIGASRMASGWLGGKVMINVDSEDEDEITIGSAGSADIEAAFDPESSPASGRAWRLEVSGLLGGHSASMIGSGRANAILLAARFLHGLGNVRVRSISAGSAPNVIPASCEAVFLCDGDPRQALASFSDDVRMRYGDSDPGITMEMSESDGDGTAWTCEATSRILDAILSCPDGPLERDAYGVRTSSNIGIARTVNGRLRVVCKPRSSDLEELNGLIGRIVGTLSSAGAKTACSEVFPPWREREDSDLVREAVRVYERVFGRPPKVTSTHGGLEASTIKGKHPGMQAISVGPTILGAHTPDERMDLGSLSRMRVYLFELVRALGGGGACGRGTAPRRRGCGRP